MLSSFRRRGISGGSITACRVDTGKYGDNCRLRVTCCLVLGAEESVEALLRHVALTLASMVTCGRVIMRYGCRCYLRSILGAEQSMEVILHYGLSHWLWRVV